MNSNNTKILFELAEEWYAEYTPNTGDTEKATEYLALGFAADLHAQEYFSLDHKVLKSDNRILIIKPKDGIEKTDQCLDGFSY